MIDNFRSNKFEKRSSSKYDQSGTFVLINTNNPFSTHKRLNEGWKEQDKSKPRYGSTTPPLALETDWRHCHTFHTAVTVTTLFGNQRFNSIFGTPKYVSDVITILKTMDKDAFPSLNNSNMNLNGLTNIRYIKKEIIQLIERENNIRPDENDDVYQDILTRFIIDTIQQIINTYSHTDISKIN